MKGWLVLDIDGTITPDKFSVPQEVVSYLREKHKEGWGVMLITGRMYAFAIQSLKSFDFPYILGLQNGADILQMPDKKLIDRRYLPTSAISKVEQAYEGIQEDFLIYAGYDRGDFCYYRKNRFSPKMLRYLDSLQELTPEGWQTREHFHFGEDDAFPLIKGVGLKNDMEKLEKILSKDDLLTISVIKDTVDENFYLALITHKEANKGDSLKRIKNMFGSEHKVIAAGNDMNDLSMLLQADVSISIGKAPQALLDIVDIAAPSASELGIIQALELATR